MRLSASPSTALPGASKVEPRQSLRRPPARIRCDLRAMLDQLAVAFEMGYAEGIRHTLREIEAMERELLFNRYGRTDVR